MAGTSDRARVPSVARLASVLAGLVLFRVVEARLAPSLRVRALQTVRALRAHVARQLAGIGLVLPRFALDAGFLVVVAAVALGAVPAPERTRRAETS